MQYPTNYQDVKEWFNSTMTRYVHKLSFFTQVLSNSVALWNHLHSVIDGNSSLIKSPFLPMKVEIEHQTQNFSSFG